MLSARYSLLKVKGGGDRNVGQCVFLHVCFFVSNESWGSVLHGGGRRRRGGRKCVYARIPA